MKNNGPGPLFNVIRVLGDAFLLHLCFVLAFLLKFEGELPSYNFDPYPIMAPFITIMALILFNFYGLYQTRKKTWSEILASLIVSLAILSIFTVVLSRMIETYTFPRSVFGIAPAVQVVVLGVWRRILLGWEKRKSRPSRVIVMAPAAEAEALAGKLTADKEEVLGLVVDGDRRQAQGAYAVLGVFDEAEEVFRRHRPDAVLMSGTLPEDIKSAVVLTSFKNPWDVYVVPGVYEIMLAQPSLVQVGDTPAFQIGVETVSGQEQVKRWMDIVISAVALVAVSPLLLLLALAVKLDSPGPVFYRQERISRRGRRFMLYKFRTMYNNAEDKTGPVLATQNDSRITATGRLLRATRLDELPQLINVLKGDMSIVGPRPERPYFVEQFEKTIPEYSYRHTMKAGMTGLAQVMSRYSTSAEDKLRYDLLYAKSSSLLFDLKIILQTMKVILMRDKAS